MKALTFPEAISTTTQPTDQISAALPCPSLIVFVNTSGAIYAANKHLKMHQKYKILFINEKKYF